MAPRGSFQSSTPFVLVSPLYDCLDFKTGRKKSLTSGLTGKIRCAPLQTPLREILLGFLRLKPRAQPKGKPKGVEKGALALLRFWCCGLSRSSSTSALLRLL